MIPNEDKKNHFVRRQCWCDPKTKKIYSELRNQKEKKVSTVLEGKKGGPENVPLEFQNEKKIFLKLQANPHRNPRPPINAIPSQGCSYENSQQVSSSYSMD